MEQSVLVRVLRNAARRFRLLAGLSFRPRNGDLPVFERGQAGVFRRMHDAVAIRADDAATEALMIEVTRRAMSVLPNTSGTGKERYSCPEVIRVISPECQYPHQNSVAHSTALHHRSGCNSIYVRPLQKRGHALFRVHCR
ncbi:hypothetical protein AGR1A_pAt20345 [Agrobacterium fabacearum CFBP 5771]|nr:hypothetical protein AGR1A_pAt20345 [Agrobacterium fabacearum CFBP 5771]